MFLPCHFGVARTVGVPRRAGASASSAFVARPSEYEDEEDEVGHGGASFACPVVGIAEFVVVVVVVVGAADKRIANNLHRDPRLQSRAAVSGVKLRGLPERALSQRRGANSVHGV